MTDIQVGKPVLYQVTLPGGAIVEHTAGSVSIKECGALILYTERDDTYDAEVVAAYPDKRWTCLLAVCNV